MSFSKSQFMTAALTLGILAIAMRVQPAKEFITGEKKFLGIF